MGQKPGTSDSTSAAESSSRVAQRVTVNLGPRSLTSLEEAVALTGDTKTEVINKAVQLYGLVQAAQDRGGGIWIQPERGAESDRVRFH